MNEHPDSSDAPKRKMSEMISEVRAAFISVGTTLAERQNRLTAVCSAWNMACAPPANRQQQLQQFADSYRETGPNRVLTLGAGLGYADWSHDQPDDSSDLQAPHLDPPDQPHDLAADPGPK